MTISKAFFLAALVSVVLGQVSPRPPVKVKLGNSANYGGTRPSTTHIILHTTQGCYVCAQNTIASPSAQVSWHYLVNNWGDTYWPTRFSQSVYDNKKQGPDGEILQQVPEDRRAYHALRGWNSKSIGIEHAGQLDSPTSAIIGTYTPTMYLSSARLVAHLCTKYNIPIRRGSATRPGIIAHGDVQSDRTDPGSSWDWTEYLRVVNEFAQGRTPTWKGPNVGTSTTAPPPPTCTGNECVCSYGGICTGTCGNNVGGGVTASCSGSSGSCCLNFKMTNAFKFYDTNKAPHQKIALDNFQDWMTRWYCSDSSCFYRDFICMYRNLAPTVPPTFCGAPALMTNVALFYRELPHQIAALNWLQDKILGYGPTNSIRQRWITFVREYRNLANIPTQRLEVAAQAIDFDNSTLSCLVCDADTTTVLDGEVSVPNQSQLCCTGSELVQTCCNNSAALDWTSECCDAKEGAKTTEEQDAKANSASLLVISMFWISLFMLATKFF